METATLENPVLKDDSFETQLRAAAEKADLGEDYELPSAEQSETRTPDETETATTSSPDTTPESKTEERPRDAQGRFTKTVAGEDIPEEQREAVKPAEPAKETTKEDSPYVKATKEQERQKTLLANFERDKAAARQEIEQERQRLAQERQQFEQQRQPAQQKPQVSAQEYAVFAQEATKKARELRLAGDYDAADEQAELAAKASMQAIAVHQQELGQEQEQIAKHYEQGFVQDMHERVRLVPELANPESPLAKEVMAVMGAYPVFERIPVIKLPNGEMMGGFSMAAEVAKLRLQAGAVSGLEAKLKEVTTERDALRGKTSLNGSSPSSPLRQKGIDDMSTSELGKYLRQQAERIDSGA